MAERLYIWIATGPEASPPSEWSLLYRTPLTPHPGEQIRNVYKLIESPNFYPAGDNEFTFIAWIQENASGSLFEAGYYDPGDGLPIKYKGCWLLIPNDDDAFAARMRWPFLKLAKW